jgi:mannan endo-1,4-beta-mannosidase
MQNKISCYFLVCVSLLSTMFSFAQIQNSMLSVVGKYLKDDCGQTIILKGVNHGNIWATNWGLDEMPQIGQTGANTIRICLERTKTEYDQNGNPYEIQTTGTAIEPIIQTCIANKMIPILEIHDFTQLNANLNATQSLPLATAFWTRSDILTILKKYQNWLILNIANEPEHADVSPLAYYQANTTAVTTLRNAGLNLPIMIDSMYWANNADFFLTYGSNLIANDPLHKLLFSIHAYWNRSEVSDALMLSRFQAMSNSNLPFFIGEFSGSTFDNTNYEYLMQLCTQFNIGYAAWWWGFTNPTSNNLEVLTPNGLFSGLNGFGLQIATTSSNSIAMTSIRPTKLVTGSCGFLSNSVFKNTNEISFYPNPVTDILNFSNSEKISKVIVYNLIGQECLSIEKNEVQSKIDFTSFKSGIYLVTVVLDDKVKSFKIIKE